MLKKLNIKIFITAYYIIVHLNKGPKEKWLIITNPNEKVLYNCWNFYDYYFSTVTSIFTVFSGGKYIQYDYSCIRDGEREKKGKTEEKA